MPTRALVRIIQIVLVLSAVMLLGVGCGASAVDGGGSGDGAALNDDIGVSGDVDLVDADAGAVDVFVDAVGEDEASGRDAGGRDAADLVAADGSESPDASASDGGGGAGDSGEDDVLVGPQPLSVSAVDPPRGLASGSEYVRILGGGFEEGCVVLFGQSDALLSHVVTAGEMTAETPPGMPGLVDVTVACPDERSASLPQGFLYFRDVVINAVDPPEGSAEGGTPVTVTGTGFRPGARLVVGGHLAVETEVIDDGTIIAVTPPGAAGWADIHVSLDGGAEGGGVAALRRGFFYTRAPHIDAVTPATGPVGGGTLVTLLGTGLDSAEAVWFGDARSPSVTLIAEDRLEAIAPPGEPGPVDVRVSTTRGVAQLDDAYHYLDPALEGQADRGPLTLLAVAPSEGSVLGGDRVALIATGLPDDGDLTVLFGGGVATVEAVEPAAGVAWLLTPSAASASTVDVSARASTGSSALSGGFRYTRALVVSEVTPNAGPAAGGTPLTVLGDGFEPGLRVYVGALPATGVHVVDARRVQAIAPVGSPGWADVRVVQGGVSATLDEAFLFEAPFDLYGVVPDTGAVAGGTQIELFGAGFTEGTRPLVGGQRCTHVEWVDPTRLTARTPPGEIGSVEVTIRREDGEERRIVDGFTYFDPAGPYGGTWGGGVEGSVNVTVLDAQGAAPLADAYVILEVDPDTPYQGWTNANGQITFSGPDVFGRQMVSASKECYSSASVVDFDAANVTLILQYNCMSSGGAPPPGIPPGEISGRVDGLWKYIIPPPGACADKPPEAVLCQPCVQDEDCGGDGALCSNLGDQGFYCTTSCVTSEDCPDGYSCKTVATELTQCLPDAGVRAAVCRATLPEVLQLENPEPGPGSEVGPDGLYHIYTRYGELAVVCLGGVRDDRTGTFTPMRLGVHRHVTPTLEANVLTDVDVDLDIPLTGSLSLRADGVEFHAGLGPEFLYSFVYLDLGSDGFFDFGVQEFSFDPDQAIEVSNMPTSFSGTIYDASYAVVLGAFSQINPDSNLPYTMTLRRHIRDIDDDTILVLDEGGSWQTEETGIRRDIHGLWGTDSQNIWAVGARGLLSHYNGGGWSPQPVDARGQRFNAIWGEGSDAIVVVGEAGSVLRFDGTSWTRDEVPTSSELRAVWGSAPDDVYVVGQYAAFHWDGAQWTPLPPALIRDLYGVWGAGPDAIWAVGVWGTVMRWDGSTWQQQNVGTSLRLRGLWGSGPDDVFVVGESGVIVHWDGASWEVMPTETRAHLHAVWGRGPDDVWAVGTRGTILHYDGRGWREQGRFDYTNTLDAIWGVTGAGASGGGPVFASGNHELLLGPFLSVPRFVDPPSGGVFAGDEIVWTVEPEATPADFTMLQIGIPSMFGEIPVWSFMADGTVTSVPLPDFDRISGSPGLGPGTYVLTGVRGYKEGFDIDAYDYMDLNQLSWRSWSIDAIPFSR